MMLCPRCDYDLTGLPEQHTCPECGCGYDQHSIGIPLTGRRHQRWALWLFIPIGGLLTVLAVQRGASGWDTLRHLMVPVAFTVGYCVRTARRAGLPTRMVLNRNGVELVTPGQEGLSWNWSIIQSVDVEWVWGRFQLISTKGEVLLSRGYPNLGSLKLAKQCAAEINKRIVIYRNPLQPEPQA